MTTHQDNYGMTTSSPAPNTFSGHQTESPTDSYLAAQLYSILPLLLLVGGDIVYRALAQATGNGPAPVSLSFGWVAFSFKSIASLVGERRLMPLPDYSCKVINLESGYARDNRNWVIGRLLRDNEIHMAKKNEDRPDLGQSLRIAIYEPSPLQPETHFMKGSHRLATLLQFAVACIPLVLGGHRDVLLLTTFGTAMALITGWLPQWKAEKLPVQQPNRKRKTIALTAGNGSRDVIVIRNIDSHYDLEELSTFEGPHMHRPWHHIGYFTKEVQETGETKPKIKVRTLEGIPLDFLATCFVCIALAAGWLLLLGLAVRLQTGSGYLLVVCLIGTAQNCFVAGRSLHPERQPIPLILCDEILGNKAMDALMDLEVTLEGDLLFVDREGSVVQPLRDIYFPGRSRMMSGEIEWWAGERNKYDELRLGDKHGNRGTPRSRWFSTTASKETKASTANF